MKIRPAKPEDAAEIANVHINSWREVYKGLLPQSFLDARPLYFKNRYELWKRVTSNSEQSTFVAESDDNGVIGFVNGGAARDGKFKGSVEVLCLYLLQHYHGQKIGLNLLKACFDDWVQKGFSKAYLWVLEGNPAIRFYEKVGASKVDDTKKDVIDGLELIELCYVWDDIKIQLK